jgi:hypothetical protein
LIQSAAHDLPLAINNDTEGVDNREHGELERANLAEGAALPAALSFIRKIRPLAGVGPAASALVP